MAWPPPRAPDSSEALLQAVQAGSKGTAELERCYELSRKRVIVNIIIIIIIIITAMIIIILIILIVNHRHQRL